MKLICEQLQKAVVVAQRRMSHFVVGLTNNNPYDTDPVYKQYRHAQYDKILPVGATGSVSFAAPAVFRYVIVQQQFSQNDAICMLEVKVFKRGTNNPLQCRCNFSDALL